MYLRIEVSPTIDGKEAIKQDTSPSMGLANHASVPFPVLTKGRHSSPWQMVLQNN